jgi:FkbM family methyltransferase
MNLFLSFLKKHFSLFRKILKSVYEYRNYIRRKIFYGSFIEKNSLCFDVGANVGNRVAPLLELGARVVAIEPQDDCCKALQKKFGKDIVIVKKGIGGKEGVRSFYISNSNTISSFSEKWINSVKANRFKDYIWEKVVEIQMTTLDKLIEEFGVPHFIKIDVEGYELEALKGLTKPIKMISFEYTVPEQTDVALKCIEQIERHAQSIECNYSAGESMNFHFKNWQSVEQMKDYIKTFEFEQTGHGDIYLRMRSDSAK